MTQTQWLPLKIGGRWNPALLKAFDKKSGAYAVRLAETRRVLYVGESHTDRGWRTLLRHFQDPTGKFKKLGEWTHHEPERLEAKIWVTSKGEDATCKEADLIARLRPLHNHDEGSCPRAEDFPFGHNVKNPTKKPHPGYVKTHGGLAGDFAQKRMRVPNPRAGELVVMGTIKRIEYIADKGQGESLYFHDFGRDVVKGVERGRPRADRMPVLAFNREGLVIAGGSYDVKPEGIVG